MNKSKKGQLSAEMLILLAVLLAVAALVAYQVMNMAKVASEKTGKTANSTFDAIDKIGGCTSDSDCPQGMICDTAINKCK